jgi:hypothetical protein
LLLAADESASFADAGAVADARAAPADLGRGFKLLPLVSVLNSSDLPDVVVGCLVDDFEGDDGRFEDVFLLFSWDLAGASPKTSVVAMSALTTAAKVNNAKVTKLLA